MPTPVFNPNHAELAQQIAVQLQAQDRDRAEDAMLRQVADKASGFMGNRLFKNLERPHEENNEAAFRAGRSGANAIADEPARRSLVSVTDPNAYIGHKLRSPELMGLYQQKRFADTREIADQRGNAAAESIAIRTSEVNKQRFLPSFGGSGVFNVQQPKSAAQPEPAKEAQAQQGQVRLESRFETLSASFSDAQKLAEKTRASALGTENSSFDDQFKAYRAHMDAYHAVTSAALRLEDYTRQLASGRVDKAKTPEAKAQSEKELATAQGIYATQVATAAKDFERFTSNFDSKIKQADGPMEAGLLNGLKNASLQHSEDLKEEIATLDVNFATQSAKPVALSASMVTKSQTQSQSQSNKQVLS